MAHGPGQDIGVDLAEPRGAQPVIDAALADEALLWGHPREAQARRGVRRHPRTPGPGW